MHIWCIKSCKVPSPLMYSWFLMYKTLWFNICYLHLYEYKTLYFPKAEDGMDSGGSSEAGESEEDNLDHHLLIAPNSDVAFFKDKPVRLAKDILWLFPCPSNSLIIVLFMMLVIVICKFRISLNNIFHITLTLSATVLNSCCRGQKIILDLVCIILF